MSVVSIGDACMDIYDEPVNKKRVGVNALNVAVYLARLGLKVSFIGVIGEDKWGREIIQALENEGVDFSKVVKKEGQTAVTEVTLNNGERIFTGERIGILPELDIGGSEYDYISTHDHVHHSGFTSWKKISPQQDSKMFNKITNHLRNFAKMDLTVSFDFSQIKEQDFFVRISDLIDFAFFSQPKLTEAEVKEFAEKRFKEGPSIIVITRGPKGSFAYDGDDYYFKEPHDIETNDTLGAGDAFIAGFLAERLAQTGDIAKSLDQATNTAATACERVGAW